jgi:ergothioneine biosynthesis protein EgtB
MQLRTPTALATANRQSDEPEARRAALVERYVRCRAATDALTAPLSSEDQQLQSLPLTSPTKWHRAHTTWFFETFMLLPAGFATYDAGFGRLFNSYYETVGERVARERRGLLSRPNTREVTTYRWQVDAGVVSLLESLDGAELDRWTPVLELGLAHEEQHQELILTDIVHAFSENPCAPAYRDDALPAPRAAAPLAWHSCAGGVVELGALNGEFVFDNERPRHRVYLGDYELASRPISVAEVKAFIRAGGYQTPSLWLAEGYERARALEWDAPLYTRWDGDGYRIFGLRGWRSAHDDEPASHLSFWEADAVARFLGARLPTEAEWEWAARGAEPATGNFADGPLCPVAPRGTGLSGLYGDVWEWTRSSYAPYPGYRAPAGPLGEYNGKFMAQQMVLRGGSCLTPRGHVRSSYRNFWHPDTRFQMTGSRLARDL